MNKEEYIDEEESEEEELEEDEKPKKYQIEYECDNCANVFDMYVPFKQTVEEYTKTHRCNNCGCFPNQKTKEEKKNENV